MEALAPWLVVQLGVREGVGMSDIVIHIVRHRATPAMMSEMLQSLGSYVKLAVDVRREVLAG